MGMENTQQSNTPDPNQTQAATGTVTPASSTQTQTSSTILGAPEGQGTQQGTDVTTTITKAPDKYELKLSDGSRMSQTQVDEIATYAKARGLSQEQAQELLTREETAVNSWASAQEQQFEQTKQKWVDELKTDKQYGGDKFNRTVELAKRAFSRFAPESFKELLNSTGLGNHPDLVKTFANIGAIMAEDSLVTGGTRAPTQKKSVEELLYGETKME